MVQSRISKDTRNNIPASMEDIDVLVKILDKNFKIYEDINVLLNINQEEIILLQKTLKLAIDDITMLKDRMDNMENLVWNKK